ncbi:MAG: hypothetical protein CR972_01885 [Candidatus Moraniibacteriota bacterium]|nr:MAG: hypothetical protein CR972_01885 [Candidatus Moranbacteria bacterium]
MAIERNGSIAILDENFKDVGNIPFKLGRGNTGTEGIACSPNGLYVTEQGGNTVYEINFQGTLLDTFSVTHEDLSGADYSEGFLYVLSDKDDVIMKIRDKKVIDEININQKGEWEGIKVMNEKIYIIEDDES